MPTETTRMVWLSVAFPKLCSITPSEGTVDLPLRMPTSTHSLFQYASQPSQIIGVFSKEGIGYRNLGDEEGIADHDEVTEVRNARCCNISVLTHESH